MAIDSILYFGLIMLVEYGMFDKLNHMLMNTIIGTGVEVKELEDDVLIEKERVSNKIAGTCILNFSLLVLQEVFYVCVIIMLIEI
jgi:hypothetical protein